ncbi:putative isxo2-like transposase domain protein [Trichonephila clavipes]|nr:putative isxo2-like transposase domain protein [Trichonephila clavipes]
MKKGLIAASAECSVSKKAMRLMKRNSSDGYIRECRKSAANGYRMKRSVRKNSWFDEKIDESMLGKRKYNRGKRVNETWVFGGIERSTNKCFFHVVQDRSKNTLLASIKRNIKEGTTIISDCWESYDCMEDEDFLHLLVNHKFFKDSETGAHTNSIEVSWSAIKNLYGKPASVRINLIFTLRSSCGEN